MAVLHFRRDTLHNARVATEADLETVRRLLDRSSRAYSTGGDTLDRRIAAGFGWVLNAGRDILAFVSADMRPFSIAGIVAAVVGNGERSALCADRLLPLVEGDLRARGVVALVHIGHASWLTEMLEDHGFGRRETVLTYGWNASRVAVLGNRFVVVQPGTMGFLEDIVALDQRIFGRMWHKPASELQRAVVSKTCDFTVATMGGQLVGYQWNERDGTHGHLTRLAVSPEWQGREVGTRLLTQALAGMVDAGITWITLNTQLSNTRSRSLYERFGFQTVGQPAPVLWKELPSPTVGHETVSTGQASPECGRLFAPDRHA